MFSSKSTELSPERANGLADHAAAQAQHAIEASRQVANDTCDSLSEGVQTLRHEAAPVLNRVADKAASIGQRSWNALHDGSQQLRSQAQHASDSTLGYVRDKPAQAMLIAAAGGAVLMALMSLMGSRRR